MDDEPIQSLVAAARSGSKPALHDMELTPKHPADAHRIVPVDDSAAQYGLTFVATLVPIGCTMLRRAAFPLQRR
jgi:hypothetical protein